MSERKYTQDEIFSAWNEGYAAGELDGAFGLNGHEPPDERNPYRPKAGRPGMNEREHTSGDVTVIGPECFTDSEATVISYKGQNYYLQDASDE